MKFIHRFRRKSSRGRRTGSTKQLLFRRNGDDGYSIEIIYFDQGAASPSRGEAINESILVLSGRFSVECDGTVRQLPANGFWQLPRGATCVMRCIAGPGAVLLLYTSSVPEPTEPDEWLQKMYTVAWDQYTHEDDMGQKRDSVFAVINAALIAALAAVSPWLWRAGPVHIFDHKVHLGLAILGLLAIVFGILAIQINSYWRSVAEAGSAYLNLRWSVARAIEVYLHLHPIGLADVENRWQEHSRSNESASAEGSFNPYPDLFGLEGLLLSPRPRVSGWSSVLHIAKVLIIMWWVILASGVGAIVTSIVDGIL